MPVFNFFFVFRLRCLIQFGGRNNAHLEGSIKEIGYNRVYKLQLFDFIYV